MSQKRKSQPQGLVDRFFYHLLFTKRFHYETPLSVDVVMKRLDAGCWSKARLKYSLTSERVDAHHHMIDMRTRDKSRNYTIVHSLGKVEGDDNASVIVGEIRFGIAYVFLLGVTVLWVFFVFWFLSSYFASSLLVLMMLPLVFTFVEMFWKRHKMLKDIENSIQPRMSDRQFEKRKHRLEDSQAEHQFDELDDGLRGHEQGFQS